MKTVRQIRAQQRRAAMRHCALEFRECTHPNVETYTGSFSERMERAAFYVQQAIDYRRMALAHEKEVA